MNNYPSGPNHYSQGQYNYGREPYGNNAPGGAPDSAPSNAAYYDASHPGAAGNVHESSLRLMSQLVTNLLLIRLLPAKQMERINRINQLREIRISWYVIMDHILSAPPVQVLELPDSLSK